MSEVSFSKVPTGAVITEQVPTPVAGVTVESTTIVAPAATAVPAVPAVPAVAGPTGPAGIPGNPGVPAVRPAMAAPAVRGGGLFRRGEFIPGLADIVVPKINIAQSIGELGETHPVGTIIYNKEVAIYSPPIIDKNAGTVTKPGTAPIRLVCLGFDAIRYVEKVPGGGQGIIVHTEQAVRESGGTLDYNEHKLKEKDGMKLFNPMADGLFAIERPEHMVDDDTVFTFPVDGKKFALAKWSFVRSSYTVIKTSFFTAFQMGCLKAGGYPSMTFALTSKFKQYPGNHSAYIPVFNAPVKSSPAVLEWVNAILNPAEVAASDAAQA